MSAEEKLIEYVAAGGKLSAPENATARYRAELMRLMAVFVDSEMAGASGFADCINLAPGLKDRITAGQIVVEKFGHASLVLAVMEQFGAQLDLYVGAHPWAARLDRSVYLGTRRVGGDMRLNVFHAPIYGWVDAMVLNMLMGRATVLQVDELARCSYQPLADVMGRVLPVETRHAELGEKGLAIALDRGHDPIDLRASLRYWHRRVADTFGKAGSEHFAAHRAYGLRSTANETLLAAWERDIGARIARLGLTLCN